MWCPYCGYEMREGHVRLRGQWAALAGVLAVNFETSDGSGEGSELLPRTLFRAHPRAAHCCVRCEAVLVEPKSGTYVPPADAGAATTATTTPATTTPTAGATGDAPTEASTGTGTDADIEAAGKGNGNGLAPGS
jgi:hypothetical protein